jgi:hypothetical protein
MKNQRSQPEPEAPKERQYGYKIKLKCQVAPTEIEWTTETTDARLNTTSKVRIEKFDLLRQEMDPS